jgi:hypothetical protein
MGIRSERRLCAEVHLNLAYRWLCRLGLDGDVPDQSTFSKNRHGRFRDSDLLRELFENAARRCMAEGLVGGEGYRRDPSFGIKASPGVKASRTAAVTNDFNPIDMQDLPSKCLLDSLRLLSGEVLCGPAHKDLIGHRWRQGSGSHADLRL